MCDTETRRGGGADGEDEKEKPEKMDQEMKKEVLGGFWVVS